MARHQKLRLATPVCSCPEDPFQTAKDHVVAIGRPHRSRAIPFARRQPCKRFATKVIDPNSAISKTDIGHGQTLAVGRETRIDKDPGFIQQRLRLPIRIQPLNCPVRGVNIMAPVNKRSGARKAQLRRASNRVQAASSASLGLTAKFVCCWSKKRTISPVAWWRSSHVHARQSNRPTVLALKLPNSQYRLGCGAHAPMQLLPGAGSAKASCADFSGKTTN